MSRSLVFTDFETNRAEATIDFLKQYLDNARIGITPETYLRMEEEMGREPDYSNIPPDYDSFPSYVHVAIDIFNSLPDMYSGGMSSIYAGKNYSSLEIIFSMYLVDTEDRMKVFTVLQFLDSRAKTSAIKEANKAAKGAKK